MIARAIILDINRILLIHRFKKGREYYALPGGHIKTGELKEDTVIREVKEETNLDIEIDQLLWTLTDSNNSKHYFFLVKKFSGDLQLGGPERIRNSEENKYILEWHELKNMPNLPIVPEDLKQKLIERFVE